MEGEERRNKIVELLTNSNTPISGSELSKALSVSRQVIVQDIALLRANNRNILSTTRGYVMYAPDRDSTAVRRTIAVNHEDLRTKEELYLIVDNGGIVLNVSVQHDVYGRLTGELIIRNRRDADQFIDRISRSTSQSLLTLTGGNHFHTIEAPDEATLNDIEAKLKETGFLQE